MIHPLIGHLPTSQLGWDQVGMGVPSYELVFSMRCVWEALNVDAVWGMHVKVDPKGHEWM